MVGTTQVDIVFNSVKVVNKLVPGYILFCFVLFCPRGKREKKSKNYGS